MTFEDFSGSWSGTGIRDPRKPRKQRFFLLILSKLFLSGQGVPGAKSAILGCRKLTNKFRQKGPPAAGGVAPGFRPVWAGKGEIRDFQGFWGKGRVYLGDLPIKSGIPGLFQEPDSARGSWGKVKGAGCVI